MANKPNSRSVRKKYWVNETLTSHRWLPNSMERKFPVASVDRGQHPSKYRSSFEATLQFHSERKDDASAYALCVSNRHTGMPILRALSARFSTIPEPGKTMMPIGSASSIASLRLNGAAFLCRVQSGSNATGATLRLSAQQAAMRSAPFGPAHGEDHVRVLRANLVERRPDALMTVAAGAAC